MDSPKSYWYKLVDVFAEKPFEGNQLAVFLDAAAMAPALMQKTARELNLSETVFLLPAKRSDCAIAVKIFTPLKEMTFAGHPTIGAAFVALMQGMVTGGDDGFYLEEEVGPVHVFAPGDGDPLLWLTTPPITYGRTFDRGDCAAALGVKSTDLLEAPPQLLSAGNPTIFVALATKAVVDRTWLDAAGLNAIRGSGEPMCVFVFTPTDDGAYARMFAPEYGIPEDPATGSSVGPLAAYLLQYNLRANHSADRLIIEQGTKLGRRSILHVRVDGPAESPRIMVGGHVVQVAEGWMTV